MLMPRGNMPPSKITCVECGRKIYKNDRKAEAAKMRCKSCRNDFSLKRALEDIVSRQAVWCPEHKKLHTYTDNCRCQKWSNNINHVIDKITKHVIITKQIKETISFFKKITCAEIPEIKIPELMEIPEVWDPPAKLPFSMPVQYVWIPEKKDMLVKNDDMLELIKSLM